MLERSDLSINKLKFSCLLEKKSPDKTSSTCFLNAFSQSLVPWFIFLANSPNSDSSPTMGNFVSIIQLKLILS